MVPQKADQPDWAGRVAGTIRTDGATLLLHAISRERPPASAMTTTIALTDTERAYPQGQRSAASPP